VVEVGSGYSPNGRISLGLRMFSRSTSTWSRVDPEPRWDATIRPPVHLLSATELLPSTSGPTMASIESDVKLLGPQRENVEKAVASPEASQPEGAPSSGMRVLATSNAVVSNGPPSLRQQRFVDG
jgi:hypothetical protein